MRGPRFFFCFVPGLFFPKNYPICMWGWKKLQQESVVERNPDGLMSCWCLYWLNAGQVNDLWAMVAYPEKKKRVNVHLIAGPPLWGACLEPLQTNRRAGPLIGPASSYNLEHSAGRSRSRLRRRGADGTDCLCNGSQTQQKRIQTAAINSHQAKSHKYVVIMLKNELRDALRGLLVLLFTFISIKL